MSKLKEIISMLSERESIMLNLRRGSPLLKEVLSEFFTSGEKRSIIASLKNISNSEIEVWIKKTRVGVNVIIYAPSASFSKNVKI